MLMGKVTAQASITITNSRAHPELVSLRSSAGFLSKAVAVTIDLVRNETH